MMTVVTFVLYALILALYIWALVDCVQTPAAQIRGLPKVGRLLLPPAVPVVPAATVSEEASR
jgi:hypothetical protein